MIRFPIGEDCQNDSNNRHSYTYAALHLSHRVVLTLGKEQESSSLPLAKIKEGQMVACGGSTFTNAGPNDRLCVQFIITSFKYH